MGLRALYLDREGASTYATDGERQIREAIEADDREKKLLAQEPEARALALNRLNSRLGMPEEDYKTSWGRTSDSGIEAAQRSMDGTSIGAADNARYNSPQTNKWAEKAQSSPYMGAAEDVRYDTLPKAPPIPVPSIAPSKPLEFNNSWANNATPNNEDRPFSWNTLPEAMRPDALTNLVPKPSEPVSFNMGAAEGTRYNSPQDNKWMAGEPPAIAQAVARKRRDPSAFLSEMQSGFIDPYRLHTANMANQMRTAISDASQAVPGVKPLTNMDYRQPVMDEIGYRKDVEAQNRQRLQDQLAYMKQLEGEDGTADWTVVDTKTGPIQHNKRTGEVKPLGTYGGATRGPVGKLTHKTDDVLDSNGNIVKQDFFLDEAGGFFVYSNGVLSATDPNYIPWVYKNPMAELSMKQSQAEKENNQKRIDSLGGLNLSDGKTIAFGGPVDQKSKDSLVSAQAVSKAYKGLMQDKEFRDLTTKGKDAKENAAKVIRLNQKMQQDGAKFQVFLAAQATAMNSGVMNVGERANYQLVLAGLPEDLLTNEAYQINKNVKAGFADIIQYMADKVFNKKLAVEDLYALQDRVATIAASYPHLVDPTKVRTAVKNITENAVDMAFNNIKTIGLGSNRLPAGSPFMGVDDPYVTNFFNELKTWDDAAYEKQLFDNKMIELNAPSIGINPQGTPPPPARGNKIGASLKERAAANAAKKKTLKKLPAAVNKGPTTLKTPVTKPPTPVSQTDWLLNN